MRNGDPFQAERWFFKSLETSRLQGSLSFQLRAAASACRMWIAQGNKDRTGEALVLLQDVYSQFTEGFGTYDLQTAKSLLDSAKEKGRS